MDNTVGIQFHIKAAGRPVSRVLPAALALYAAALLVLGELFAAPPFLPALLLGAAGIAICMLWGKPVCLPVMAALGALLFAFPATRAGVLLLVRRLYAASAAVNAYVYDELAIPPVDEAAALRAAVTALCLLLGALCAAAASYRWVALPLFLSAAALEAVFGVTPAAWKNLLLFAALALQLVRGSADRRQTVAALAAALAVLALVFLLAPRPNAAIERDSERLRDVLEPAPSAAPRQTPPPEAEINRTHQESRQHEENAEITPTQQPQQGFAYQTEPEREISLPHRVDYLRIALLLLAVIVLLLVPFLPFLLMNRARRRTEETRASFALADNAAAIRAMFRHLMTWLRLCGLETENRTFAQCGEAVEAMLPAALSARFAAAANIWQEAEYSDHEMTAQQREAVRALLQDTARLLYERAPARRRFRLKYIDCLCEG